jgi:hypothetical protein
MPKSAKSLPVRQYSGEKWEVEMEPGNWVKCETKEDAEILSNAPIVMQKSYEVFLPNKAVATELEKMAEKLEQYNIGTAVRLFQKRAKLARGEQNGSL